MNVKSPNVDGTPVNMNSPNLDVTPTNVNDPKVDGNQTDWTWSHSDPPH